jgi:hypothetical protein
MAYQSLNPATGKLLMSFPDLTDAQLETKLAAAEACYRTWRLTSYSERAAILLRASVLLHDQAENFAHTMTLEMGKKIGEARGEAEFSANILAYYAKNAERFLAPEMLHPSLGEQPDRRDLRRGALELSLLPVGARGRAAFDGGQRAGHQARGLRPPMRDRVRKAIHGRRRSFRTLHQSTHRPHAV